MRALNHPFLWQCLMIIGVILCVSGNHLFDQTMFMDGLTYTDVSLNMMSGDGSVWSPKYTEVWNPFYEHPSLAYMLQSFILAITGAPLWGDAIYGIVCFVFVFAAMVKTFKLLGKRDSSVSILPILLLFTCPIVWWSIGNNILENTLMVFTTWASYYLIKNTFEKTLWRPILAGMLVAGAFLSKGFTGLFPISLPFILMFIKKPIDYTYFFRESCLVVVGIIFVSALLFIDKNAIMFFESYMDQQVIRSLNGIQTVDSRFDILLRYFLELLPMIGIVLAVYIYRRIKVKPIVTNAWVLALLIYSLTPVLPICISLKQGAFYILAAYPVAALAVALWLSDNVDFTISKVWKKVTVAVVFIVGMGNAIIHFNRLGAHEEMINEVDEMALTVDGMVGCDHETYIDWSLQTYLYRRHLISLDNVNPYNYQFIIMVQSKRNYEITDYKFYKSYGNHIIFKRND